MPVTVPTPSHSAADAELRSHTRTPELSLEAARTAGRSGTSASSRAALYSLSFGNFVVGTGTMIVAGLVNVMAADLHTSAASVGQLITGYSLAVCLGAPVLASATTGVARRTLLVVALALFAAGHFASAAAPNYPALMAIRVLTGFSAAVFTPQAAALAGVLVSAEQRGRAIALVFLGFSLASVVGSPLGIALGNALGWRASLAAIGAVAALCAVLLRALLPSGAPVPALNRAVWGDVARDRTMLLVLATTVLQASGQFVLVAYLTVAFQAHLDASSATIGLLFGWFGLFGLIGNVCSGAFVDRIGTARVVTMTLLLMLAAMLVWPLTRGSHAFTLLALTLWGLGCFSANSAQQARLVALSPRLASASVSLNSSGFYLGQASGAALGGVTLSLAGLPALSWVGAALIALALVTSAVAQRDTARQL